LFTGLCFPTASGLPCRLPEGLVSAEASKATLRLFLGLLEFGGVVRDANEGIGTVRGERRESSGGGACRVEEGKGMDAGGGCDGGRGGDASEEAMVGGVACSVTGGGILLESVYIVVNYMHYTVILLEKIGRTRGML